MATSLEAVQAAGNLSDRVSFFVVKAAIAVMYEDNTTANHPERVAFAESVLISGYDIMQYTYSVLSNPTVLAGLDLSEDDLSVGDGDIEFIVNSVFNAFAGVST